MPELQKLCLNCQHFEFDYPDSPRPQFGEPDQPRHMTFRCEKDRYDLKRRGIAQGQFLMYMYMGQQCPHFQVLDFKGPKGRAGLPSGESFGSGGSIEASPPPGDAARPQVLKA